jgi:ankyrin repeat protein
MSPLLKAAQFGHVDCVRLLTTKGAPLEETFESKTPLHYAVAGDHISCVQCLVDCGANVEAQTSSGQTPLHLAAKQGWVDGMRILVDHGAELEARDSEGQTPLYIAASLWRPPKDCVLLLKERGAAVDTSNNQGETVAAKVEHILNSDPSWKWLGIP